MTIEWHETLTDAGATGREFTFHGSRAVTGILWSSATTGPGAPLVCFGHGASGSRHQRPIPLLAQRLANESGIFGLAIDGPVHGRREADGGGRAAFWPEWRREGTVEDMVEDWRAVVDAIRQLPDVGTGPVGYWGLSMGTIYGVPTVAALDCIEVAVLGLMGVTDEPRHYRPTLLNAATHITCPVLFIWQLEDELFTRDECLALFDALASDDKRLHANPGLHPDVPLEELDQSIDFLRRYLSGTPPKREVLFKVSE